MPMQGKKVFVCGVCGDIHVGMAGVAECPTCLTPNSYTEATAEQAVELAENPAYKFFWRCTVCNDLHIGENPVSICPTCTNVDAYVQSDKNEFLALLGEIEVKNG